MILNNQNSLIFQAALQEMTNYDPINDKDNAHLLLDMEFDSLDVIEFVMKLEIKFDISIDDDKARQAITLGDMKRLINEYLENKNKPLDPNNHKQTK